MRTYHLETRTIKVFISLWHKHATMPLTRLAVCFVGRISIHDRFFTKPLRALSPFPTYPIPHLPYSSFMLLMLFLFLLSCFTLYSLNFPPCSFPPRTCSLISFPFTPTVALSFLISSSLYSAHIHSSPHAYAYLISFHT